LPKHLPITSEFAFKKEEKLKGRKLIEQLFASGKSFSVFPFRVTYIFSKQGTNILQCGFGTSTKKFRKSVDRNRVKRLMREAYRLQQNGLKAVLQTRGKSMAVFFIYTANIIYTYTEIYKSMQACLRKLEKVTHEINDENT
jgi:ribonuclease P protein component